MTYVMDDEKIPVGYNNNVSTELYFEFGQVASNIIYMMMGDNS